MGVTTWTDESVATLERLWAEGYSATRIGITMDRTRGSVIGKVDRLGLPPPAAKQDVIVDRTYTRQCVEITKANKRAREQRSYEKRKYDIKSKLDVRMMMLARGATKTSAAYRKHLPPAVDMSKTAMRAMLTQALQNTAAL